MSSVSVQDDASPSNVMPVKAEEVQHLLEFGRRKRENHAKMVKDLQTTNVELSRSLQESGNLIRRLNNAAKELFSKRKGDVTGLSAGVVSTCLVVSQPQN